MANTSVFIPVITPVVTGAGLSGVGTVGDPLINTVTTTIGDTQVAYATSANTIGGDAGLTYDGATDLLAFVSGGGAKFAGAANPITLTGGDNSGSTALKIDNPLDGYVVLEFSHGFGGTDWYVSGNWSLTAVDASISAGGASPNNNFLFTAADTSFTGNVQLVGTGSAIRTDTTTAHSALLQAYDVNGTTYRTFATLTNGDVPSFTVSQPAGGLLVLSPPTTDPHVSGALWNNSGVVALSTG